MDQLVGVLTHSGVDDIGGTSLNERIAKEGGALKVKNSLLHKRWKIF